MTAFYMNKKCHKGAYSVSLLLWFLTCSLVDGCQHFGEPYCLHLQVRKRRAYLECSWIKETCSLEVCNSKTSCFSWIHTFVQLLLWSWKYYSSFHNLNLKLISLKMGFFKKLVTTYKTTQPRWANSELSPSWSTSYLMFHPVTFIIKY